MITCTRRLFQLCLIFLVRVVVWIHLASSASVASGQSTLEMAVNEKVIVQLHPLYQPAMALRNANIGRVSKVVAVDRIVYSSMRVYHWMIHPPPHPHQTLRMITVSRMFFAVALDRAGHQLYRQFTKFRDSVNTIPPRKGVRRGQSNDTHQLGEIIFIQSQSISIDYHSLALIFLAFFFSLDTSDLCDFVHMHNRPCAFYKSGECKKGSASNNSTGEIESNSQVGYHTEPSLHDWHLIHRSRFFLSSVLVSNACDFIHSDEPSPTH